MAKTKLLLAFGSHGSSKIKGDRNFFRDTIIPFLEEHVVKGRGKAALIQEGVAPVYIIENRADPGLEQAAATLDWLRNDREGFLGAAAKPIAEFASASAAYFRNVADRGFLTSSSVPECEEARGVEWPIEAWGFEEYAVGLNKAKPDTVRFFMEPQNAEAIYADIYSKMLSCFLRQDWGDPVLATGYMTVSIEAMILRDRALVDLADRLAQENPDIAIIIPRGRGHAPMEVLFDRSRYDISLHIGSPSVLTFENDAIVKAYGGTLSRRELSLYAKLEQEFYQHAKSIGFDLDSDVPNERLFEIAQQNYQSAINILEKLFLLARTHAIAKNPEIAKELGIRE